MEQSQNSIDVLLFAEDPGGADYLASFPNALKERGLQHSLFSTGFARGVFDRQKIFYTDISSKIEELGNEKLFLFAEDLIKKLKPRLVIVGTAENKKSLGLSLIDAAKKAGIPSIGAVDAFMNAKARFSGETNNSLAHSPDYVLVADESTKTAFEELSFKSEKIIVCGHPLYDLVLNSKKELEKTPSTAWRKKYFHEAKAGQKIVVFLDEGSARLAKTDPSQEGRTEWALGAFLSKIKTIEPKPYVAFRLHPKDTIQDFEKFLSQIDFVSNQGSKHEMLMATDLVVSCTTILLTEAALLGRNTLSFVPNKEEGQWLPSVRAGITPCVDNIEDLQKEMNHLLHNEQNNSQKKFVMEKATDNAMKLIEGIING